MTLTLRRTLRALCLTMTGLAFSAGASSAPQPPAAPATASASASQPAWSHAGVPTAQALALVRELQNAAGDGLNPADYTGPWSTPTAGQFAQDYDAQLTTAARRFLHDLHFGRVDPKSAGFDLPQSRPPLDLNSLLNRLATRGEAAQVAAEVEPQFIHYRLLKQALQHYRQLQAGQVTPTAQEAAQAPYAVRIRQIELTLERWRWLPEFSQPPIIVNIPQFRLFAFHTLQDRRDDILQMDVIVGKTYPTTRTPVFMQDLKYVVFRPYWDVPYSITQKEIIPALRKNPGYLDKERLQLVDGTGQVVPYSASVLEQLQHGGLRVRQAPGPDNSLGLIKFMLPNHYNVYLHSTPAHSLFSRTVRAFSHGCIRVKDPVALAQYVLRDTPGNWAAENISKALDRGPDNTVVRLKTPIPVAIMYATVLAQEDGQVLFFKDIYGHDAKLEQLLHLQAAN